MNTTNVAIINGISLQVVASESEQLVAVKPVREILGVDDKAQRYKINEHPLFSSVRVLSTSTGADGKAYEMVCLPLRYFPSWLFSINPNNVKEEIRENLLEYQKKCNDILYDYFFSRAEFAQKKEREFSRQMEVVATAKENFHNAKRVLNEAETRLKRINASTFEDFMAEERQLRILGFD
ncbi:MAG: hypothetical protein II886_13630 [Prevotella sp.]|nr:hypothetical protein [Prevotella sp.]